MKIAFAFCLAISISCLPRASAAAPEHLFPKLRVRIVNPEGAPIEGAVVDAWLINDAYSWQSTMIKRQPVLSRADGIATIRYPKGLNLGGMDVKVETIKMIVTHSDYHQSEFDVAVESKEGEPRDLVLQPGITLRLSAVTEQGDPLTQPFAVLSTHAEGVLRWHRETPNQARCGSLTSGNHQIMLVQPQADGYHLFSDVYLNRFDKEQEPKVVIDEIEMRPGIAVRGKLASHVPRPIQNGKVIAIHVPLPSGNRWEDQLPSVLYNDSTTLSPEGIFEFRSMPRTGIIQLIALCDGWVGLGDKEKPFVVGENFDVDEQDLDVELKMERTFDAKLRIVDQTGQPLQGIIVGFSPNQLQNRGGATILGNAHESMPDLLGQFDETPVPINMAIASPFQGESDEDGRVVVRNLPRNRLSTFFGVMASAKATKQIIPPAAEETQGKLPADGANEVEIELVLKTVDP